MTDATSRSQLVCVISSPRGNEVTEMIITPDHSGCRIEFQGVKNTILIDYDFGRIAVLVSDDNGDFTSTRAPQTFAVPNQHG